MVNNGPNGMIFNLRHIERKSVDKFFETVDVLAVLAF